MLKAIWVLIGTAWCVMICLYAVTFWAIDKSRERTACYRAAASTSDCAPPGPLESLVRRLTAR